MVAGVLEVLTGKRTMVWVSVQARKRASLYKKRLFQNKNVCKAVAIILSIKKDHTR